MLTPTVIRQDGELRKDYGQTFRIGSAWLTIASVSGLAAVISILTSIGSGMATGGGPSATNSETLPESGD